MRIIENPERERELIENSIKKYGRTSDHNFNWLMYCADEGSPRVAVWDDGYAGYAVWCYQNHNNWIILSDPIASVDQHREILSELANYLFNSGANKITFVDVRDAVHDIIRNLYPGNYKFDYDIVWPLVDMSSFDPELPGGHFKDIRNALHKFNKEHKVEIKEVNLVDKQELHGIVDRWMDARTKAGIEELYPGRYRNAIEGGFKGTDSARVMFVDGKAVGFNGGWETPNNSEEWSAAIGLHDFSIKDLGVALLMEDLVWIKDSGYKKCDLEGSDPPALHFKTQFFSQFDTYKTYTFWLNKK